MCVARPVLAPKAGSGRTCDSGCWGPGASAFMMMRQQPLPGSFGSTSRRRYGRSTGMAAWPALDAAWAAARGADAEGVVRVVFFLQPDMFSTESAALTANVTECYFQVTVLFFDGILRDEDLPVVFFGNIVLSNFSLLIWAHMAWLKLIFSCMYY
ncbi:hypothetical protein SETIT_3G313900v2 [Setaria italica]|uniref:Uncharacterized protein n=1 Tax=Setaria italica TaxID=4555 RepID=A0A368QKV7_SETIT|nr:hypothetical protein SETIT_3G313900v2 [Setaria italica]